MHFRRKKVIVSRLFPYLCTYNTFFADSRASTCAFHGNAEPRLTYQKALKNNEIHAFLATLALATEQIAAVTSTKKHSKQ
jgi:hypothetical protein